MINWLLDVFSTWNVIRATGITAYILLFLAVFAGVTLRLGLSLGRWKAVIHLLHQNSGWLTLIFSIVHGVLLLFDAYLPYNIVEILVPFAAEHQPFLSGLGTITFYLILIVMVSSDFMQRFGKKVWRYLHFSTLPAFFIALFHGLNQGTSSQESWAKLMYVITGSILIGVILMRLMNNKPKKTEQKRDAILIK